MNKTREHITAITLTGFFFLLFIIFFKPESAVEKIEGMKEIKELVNPDIINFGDPVEKEVFRQSVMAFYPASPGKADSLLQAIEEYRTAIFTNDEFKTGGQPRSLTFMVFWDITGMYIKFIIIFLIVMALTYYGAKTIGVLRFVREKQNRKSYLRILVNYLKTADHKKEKLDYLYNILALTGKALLKGLFYMILFAPAYVIAYSFKTRLETDSLFFMIILGVISNGLLINYANKFYTFLVSESKKGYVNTAVVKNLNSGWDKQAGIGYRKIFALIKDFDGHIFQHIYLNASHQYLQTIKEQASFLITGLVIIEMALNIQGHLCYELMQTILYGFYDITAVIIFLLFLLLKLTEIIVDRHYETESARLENRI